MDNEFKVLPRWVIHLFLWIGLSAGISIRSLMLVNRYHPEAAIWVWRFAMFGFIIFFGYRYLITRRRRRIVSNYVLIEKIEQLQDLDPTTREATLYILRSISRSKELFNFAFIFALSLIALILDFLMG